jgi:hypothetical protein
MKIQMNELHGIDIHDTLWGSIMMAINSQKKVICCYVLLENVATLFGNT